MSVHGFAPMPTRAPPGSQCNSAEDCAEVPLVFTLQPKRVQKKRSFCAQRPVEALIAGFGLAPPRAANRITAQLALFSPTKAGPSATTDENLFLKG